jgi:hypothetical protein
MKKILLALMLGLLTFSAVGCGGGSPTPTGGKTGTGTK